MLRRTALATLAAGALVAALTGCHGPEHVTGPQPPSPDNAQTIVPESHLTPASDESQYGGSNSNVPDTEGDQTCNPA